MGRIRVASTQETLRYGGFQRGLGQGLGFRRRGPSGGAGTPPSTDPLHTLVTGATVLMAWRASNVTESGGTVSALADLTGNGFNFTQATGANQPTYEATGGPNSRPCITGDGAARWMSTVWDADLPGTVPIWRLGIWRINSWTGGRVLWSSATAGEIALVMGGASPQIRCRNTNLGTTVATPGVSSWVCVVEHFTGVAGADSLRVGATTQSGESFGNANPDSPFGLFAQGGANFGAVSFAEGFICSAVPSNVNDILDQVDAYYGAGLT